MKQALKIPVLLVYTFFTAFWSLFGWLNLGLSLKSKPERIFLNLKVCFFFFYKSKMYIKDKFTRRSYVKYVVVLIEIKKLLPV